MQNCSLSRKPLTEFAKAVFKGGFLSSYTFFSTVFCNSVFAEPPKNPPLAIDMKVGPLPYEVLNFNKGIYKKTFGPDNCIEGEYRMLKEPKTGRVFLRTSKGVLVDHLDQRVKNRIEKDCSFIYFNLINGKNELESTEIQSCKEPLLVSNIRTLKVKFEDNKIHYVFIAKDPLKETSKKTNCELERQN